MEGEDLKNSGVIEQWPLFFRPPLAMSNQG